MAPGSQITDVRFDAAPPTTSLHSFFAWLPVFAESWCSSTSVELWYSDGSPDSPSSHLPSSLSGCLVSDRNGNRKKLGPLIVIPASVE